MRSAVLFLVVAGLAACSSKPSPAQQQLGRQFVSPDGRQAWALKCDEPDGIDQCHWKARVVCQGDYEVTNQAETPKTETSAWGNSRTRLARTLEVICKTPAPA